MNKILHTFITIRNIFHSKKPVKTVIAILLSKTGLSKYLFIHKNDFSLRFFPSSLSRSLWIDPSERQFDDFIIQNILASGDSMIDVGANIGSLTILASKVVGKNGRVYSIEPHPRIFNYLKENLELNKISNVVCYNLGVGEKEDILYFTDHNSDDQNSFLLSNEKNSLPIQVKPLDKILINNKNYNLVKIDVEGFELFVFNGAKEILKNTETIYFEAAEEHFLKFNYTFKDVYTLLNDLGFSIFRFNNNELQSLSLNSNIKKRENLIATKNYLKIKECLKCK